MDNFDPFADDGSLQMQPSNRLNPATAGTSNLPNSAANMSGNKRTLHQSLGLDTAEESENKSRRTSPGSDLPTPSSSKVDKNGFVDLCSDEEDDLAIQRQQRAEKDAATRKRMQNTSKDEEIARELQNSLNSGQAPSMSQVPKSGPSAFMKMMGPPASQAASSSTSSKQMKLPGSFPVDSDDDDDMMITGYNSRPFTSWPAVPQSQPSNSTGVAAARSSQYAPYAQLRAEQPSLNQQMGAMANATFGDSNPYGSRTLPALGASSAGPGPGARLHGGLGNYTQMAGSMMTDAIGNMIDQTSGISQSMRDELDVFVSDPRRTQEDLKNLLENIRPDMEIPKADRKGTPEGLKYPLYEHQKLALAWLEAMETGNNKGGILADDMGLGKTISTLALLLSRPSPSRNRKVCYIFWRHFPGSILTRRQTTLIVAPVALARQWESEIKNKILPSHRLSVFIHHGQKKADWSTLRNYDVVLTTYGTLGAEYKRYEALWKRKEEHPELEINDDKYQKDLHFLGKNSKWYRVILDEAQNVKNQNTKAAKAVATLQAETRFCLTGTPMMNGVHELHSLIRFLRIRPYCEQTEFNQAFGCLKNGIVSRAKMEFAMRKLQALLKAILLRRTKDSKIDGEPILQLPPKTEEVVHAVFDEDQQAYYSMLEGKAKVAFNKYLRAGTVGKNYSSILVLLLRLRQAACHPHLIMEFDEAPISGADKVALAKGLPEATVLRLKAEEAPFECPICYDALLNPVFPLDCCHPTCSECFVKITSQYDPNAEDGQNTARCPTCRGSINMNRCIDYETFKDVHMGGDGARITESEDVSEDSDDSGDTDDSSGFSDGDDGDDAIDVDRNGNIRNFIVADDEVEDEIGTDASDAENTGAEARRIGKGKRTSKVSKCVLPTLDDSDDEDDAKVVARCQTDGSDSDSETDDLDAKPKPKTEVKAVASASVKSEVKTEASGIETEVKTEVESERHVMRNVVHEDSDDDFIPEHAELPIPTRQPGEVFYEDPEDDFLPENPIAALLKAEAEEGPRGRSVRKISKALEKSKATEKRRKERKKRNAAKKAAKEGDNEKDSRKHLNLAKLKREGMRNAGGRAKYMRYLKKNWVTSAKIDKLMEILENTEEGIKTIVFSQFTTLLDLCEIPIRRAKMGMGRYDGSMSADQRFAAVEKFMTNADSKILLVSLKAGNAGLNLVAGSQVIILDPFWNPFVEMQAVDRAHRIGQMRPVKVHRILVKGTVEDRIIALQEKKRKLVESALDEHASRQVGRLGQAELIYLFNNNEERETMQSRLPSSRQLGADDDGDIPMGVMAGLGGASGMGLGGMGAGPSLFRSLNGAALAGPGPEPAYPNASACAPGSSTLGQTWRDMPNRAATTNSPFATFGAPPAPSTPRYTGLERLGPAIPPAMPLNTNSSGANPRTSNPPTQTSPIISLDSDEDN